MGVNAEEKGDKIRWLHLSDFHVGKDGYGQSQLFKYILTHVEGESKPDFVFITGDIAQSGKSEQYDKFSVEFLEPLKKIVGNQCRIFCVPGNHDVDRLKEEFVTREVIREKSQNFFDPDDNGKNKRKAIFSRFDAYAEYDQLYLDNEASWLTSPDGCFAYNADVKGCNVGILGINTAWLSENREDKGQLTAGKLIVEKGLEAIAKSDVKIVLGHHPLDWFHPDDLPGIRALFGKCRVIYLHGHLHENSSRFDEGAGRFFLNVQSGAAFQAREHDRWVNGLLWGEWDIAEQCLELAPYCWSKQHQEWSPDAQAFPNVYRIGDSTRFSLPLSKDKPVSASTESDAGRVGDNRPKIPDGWELITRETLGKFDTDPDDSVILSYFDGRIPNFGLALCPKIPRRAVVQKMCERINAATQTGNPSINMLLGAGGEGKTTAFLQIIEAVLQSDKYWRVIHHRHDSAKLGKKMVDGLPKGEHHWLIASDDADLVADDVYRIAFGLQSEGRGDVHFLLSARHTDWRNTKVTPPQWERMTGYHEEVLRGLDTEDAERVIDAWSVYDEKGLGHLAGLPKDEAVKHLVNETRSEKSREEGAFLGALLRLRFGEELKMHVKKLLDRLNEREVFPGNPNTLLEAFAYIAVMHSENKLFLSKLVLSHVLDVEMRQLRSKVLWPLGEEAAADIAGEMVFTRHRAIAEAAIDILENTLYFDVDIDELYTDLVEAAESLYLSGNFITKLAGWRFELADHFVEKNNYALAIKILQALVSINRSDSHIRVKLAQVFRKAGQPEQASQVFRNAPKPDNHRAFFREWGASEGHDGNHAVNAWLDAVAMADDSAKKPPDNKQAAMDLTGFGLACLNLFENYSKDIFIKGCGASAQLGLALRGLTSKDQRLLSANRDAASRSGICDYPLTAALKYLHEAAIAAHQQREIDLPEWVPPAGELTFDGLACLLGID